MIDKELQMANAALRVFARLRKLLKAPCLICPKRRKKGCPATECKSDKEIMLCKAKAATQATCAALEVLTGRKVTITKKEVVLE